MNPCSNSSLLRRALPAAGLALLAAFQTHAVIFSFTGMIPDDGDSVFDPNGLLPAEIVHGATFTGTFSYDPAQAGFDANPSNSTLGNYNFSNPDGSDFSLTLTLGGHTWASEVTTSPTFNQVVVWNDNVVLNDAVEYAAYRLSYDETAGLPNGLTTGEIRLLFRDDSATAINSDAAPTLVPLLSIFSSAASLHFSSEDGMGNSASFNSIILTVTPVPEPGEWAVIAGGLLGAFALARRRRA